MQVVLTSCHCSRKRVERSGELGVDHVTDWVGGVEVVCVGGREYVGCVKVANEACLPNNTPPRTEAAQPNAPLYVGLPRQDASRGGLAPQPAHDDPHCLLAREPLLVCGALLKGLELLHRGLSHGANLVRRLGLELGLGFHCGLSHGAILVRRLAKGAQSIDWLVDRLIGLHPLVRLTLLGKSFNQN